MKDGAKSAAAITADYAVKDAGRGEAAGAEVREGWQGGRRCRSFHP